jgi:hypothetical protein
VIGETPAQNRQRPEKQIPRILQKHSELCTLIGRGALILQNRKRWKLFLIALSGVYQIREGASDMVIDR